MNSITEERLTDAALAYNRREVGDSIDDIATVNLRYAADLMDQMISFFSQTGNRIVIPCLASFRENLEITLKARGAKR